MSSREQAHLVSALLGILALGNAPLDDGGAEKSRCVWLAEVAARLGVPPLREPLWEATPPDSLGSTLASAGVGRSLEPKPLRSRAQAAAARDVLIPQLHTELFHFVCRRANDALAPATTPGGGALGGGALVSVFDFAGGEAGETNGAQQLLHNYAQERCTRSGSARSSSTSRCATRAKGCSGRRSPSPATPPSSPCWTPRCSRRR